MNDYVIGLLAGLAFGILIVAILKLRMRKVARTPGEKADYLGRRRARMLPVLALLFLSQQASFFAQFGSGDHFPTEKVKIAAWLVLSIVLIATLATRGFWLEPTEVRALIDDENTRANRLDAMRWGFLFAMVAAIIVYVVTLFDTVTGREAVHLVMSTGIAAAILRWGALERRAYRDA